MPKISIVLAVKNAENTVAQTIDSVLAQTLGDFELIIVDDGSYDDTADVCEAYAEKDARIKLARQGATGMAQAYNSGVKIAKGEYIAYLDAGCYILPEMYEAMFACAEKEHADIVQCGYFIMPASSLNMPYPKTQGEVTGYTSRVWFFEDVISSEDYIAEFIKRSSGEFCNLLVKKGICKTTGLPNIKWYGHHYNVDIAVKAKRIETIPNCLFIRTDAYDAPHIKSPMDRLEFVIFLQRLFKVLSRFEDNETQLAETYYKTMVEAEKIKKDDFGDGNADIAAKLKRTAQFLKDNEHYLEEIADK